MNDIVSAALSMAAIGLLCLVAVAVECRTVADPRRHWRAALFNLAYAVVTAGALAPVTGALRLAMVLAVNAVGGGLVELPGNGLLLPVGVLAYLGLTDLMEYGFHRAQHAVPWLWRMHSLHHSEETMNATTTLRHFWLDSLIRALLIGPLAGLVFHTAPAVLLTAEALRLANHVYCHMGVRRSWRRFWWLLDSPQYHRCHHSFAARHLDRNFADIFPVWDILFGTAYRPLADEYPPTGILSRPRVNLGRALVWPFTSQ